MLVLQGNSLISEVVREPLTLRGGGGGLELTEPARFLEKELADKGVIGESDFRDELENRGWRYEDSVNSRICKRDTPNTVLERRLTLRGGGVKREELINSGVVDSEKERRRWGSGVARAELSRCR